MPRGSLDMPLATVSRRIAELEAHKTRMLNRSSRRIALTEAGLPSWPVSPVYVGQQLLPGKARAFVDFAPPRLKDRLADEAALFARL